MSTESQDMLDDGGPLQRRPTHPRKAKLPRARTPAQATTISYNSDIGYAAPVPFQHYFEGDNVAVIPFATAKQARAFVKVMNMTPDERLKKIESLFREANYAAFKRDCLGNQITETTEQTRAYALRALQALGFDAAG